MKRVGEITVTAGPWPERHGCTGWLLEPSNTREAGVYPWKGLAKNEVIVFIHDDPLRSGPHLGWSCVLGRDDIILHNRLDYDNLRGAS